MLVLVKFNDFRGNVSRGATPEEKILLNIGICGQSEVNDHRLH